MATNPGRNSQFERDLRVIKSNTVEPVVYASNQSIVSSGGVTPTVSTIEIASSQGSLSSYLHKSGISLLNDLPSCHIHQVFELNDSIRVASENRFNIKTHDNQTIFLASEGSTSRDRMLWGSSRAFLMHLMDRQHQEALTLRRVFGCHCFCFPMKKQSLEVWFGQGILLGTVQEQFSFKDREFAVETERGEIIYRTSVALGNSLCMPKEQHFRILTADQTQQVGTITRQWNSDLNSYTMNIYYADPSMDSKKKALIIGLAFLLEYLYFQSKSFC